MELNSTEQIEKVPNKFVKNLTKSGEGVIEARATLLASNVEISQQTLVNKLLGEQNQLKIKLQELEDLSPDDNTSLKVGGANFNADKWVNEVQDTKIALLNKTVEVKTAQATLEEWFKA